VLVRSGLGCAAVGTGGLPALMPQVHALAGNAEPAGDLSLADADCKQLSGAQPAGLEPVAFVLCREAASDGWHDPILIQHNRAAQLDTRGTSPEPAGHRGAWALDDPAAGWMPAKGLGRMQARKTRNDARDPSTRTRPDRAASS